MTAWWERQGGMQAAPTTRGLHPSPLRLRCPRTGRTWMDRGLEDLQEDLEVCIVMSWECSMASAVAPRSEVRLHSVDATQFFCSGFKERGGCSHLRDSAHVPRMAFSSAQAVT